MDHFSWVVKKLVKVGQFVATHKASLYVREVKWCGKLYSETDVRHDPERIRGLVEMRRSETIGELMQFLQVANWMRLPLPDMTEVVSPLRALLERKLMGTTRTKGVVSRKGIGGALGGRNPGGVAELPQVVGRYGAAQLWEAGLSRDNASGRNCPVLRRLSDASS